MPWDGSESSCYRQVIYYGVAGNWKVYELRCNRAYTPVFTRPDSLFTGRRVTGATVHFTDLAGVTSVAPPTYYHCAGARPCITSGYLELTGAVGVVGRSAVVTPVVESSASSQLHPAAVPVTRGGPSRRPFMRDRP